MQTAGNNWPSSTGAANDCFHLNTRLVAAVQKNAGAHCHESANLLQAYYFRADVYRQQLRNRNSAAAESARRSVHQAEVRLRQFLTNLLWSCPLGAVEEDASSVDCHAVAC